MWKYVSRAVREAVEKGNGIFHCRSVNAQDKLSPLYANNENSIHYDENKSDENDDGSAKSKHQTYKSTADEIEKCLNHNFLRAITCSTAMILGWYTNQLLTIRDRSLKLKSCKRCNTNRSINKYIYPKVIPYHLVLNTVWTQPLNLQSKLKFVKNEKLKDDDFIDTTKCDNTSTDVPDGAENIEKEEKTSIESIEDAAEQFAFVTGNLENKVGAAYIQNSQASDSISHFEAGTRYRNAAAAFNLGLCYELGLGTKQDDEKAAECYQIASELGSVKAMYNLAIYYAQGRGGLSIDFNQARIWFTEAANKGHKESMMALSSECGTESWDATDDMNCFATSNTVGMVN